MSSVRTRLRTHLSPNRSAIDEYSAPRELRTDFAAGLRSVNKLPTISLAELNRAAALQNRVDRKYVVTQPQLADLVDHLGPRVAALEIDGERGFGYESIYFDTCDLQSFYGSAYRRRHRFKVRTRSYLESGDVVLEVKTKDNRGRTIKMRQPYEIDEHARIQQRSQFDQNYDLDRGVETAHTTEAKQRGLSADGSLFVDSMLGAPGLGASLAATLKTSYRRSTLLDLDDVARVTIDANLRCVDGHGRSIFLADRFVVETKSPSAPGFADRYLRQVGIRPEKVSKYGTGMAVLNPALPSNKWHRTIERHFVR